MSNNGIGTVTTVSINHWELGRDFASWGSDQQAMFLHGMYAGLEGLGGAYDTQLLAVLEHANAEGFERDLEELAITLHVYLTPEREATA